MECQLTELAHRVLHTSSDYEVLGSLVLQDEPHTLHVVLGISPVAQRREVAQIQLFLLALGNACCRQRYLSCNECLAATFTLVVEEYARAAEHIVCLAVLPDNPETIELSHSIGAVGMERSELVLGHLLHFSIELRG